MKTERYRVIRNTPCLRKYVPNEPTAWHASCLHADYYEMTDLQLIKDRNGNPIYTFQLWDEIGNIATYQIDQQHWDSNTTKLPTHPAQQLHTDT